MNRTRALIGLTCGLFLAAGAYAAALADVPAGSTGMCKDDTYYSGATKKGACRGHQGVKVWWGADAPRTATGATVAAASVAAAAGTAAVSPAPTPAPAAKSTPQPETVAAAGGGAGKVWANDSTKVYHCSTDKSYGKTKQGEYMSEADAKAKGFHAEHGKACSQ